MPLQRGLPQPAEQDAAEDDFFQQGGRDACLKGEQQPLPIFDVLLSQLSQRMIRGRKNQRYEYIRTIDERRH